MNIYVNDLIVLMKERPHAKDEYLKLKVGKVHLYSK